MSPLINPIFQSVLEYEYLKLFGIFSKGVVVEKGRRELLYKNSPLGIYA